jgi:hypothetical protein
MEGRYLGEGYHIEVKIVLRSKASKTMFKKYLSNG